jgi:excisionase family DNA binding protein
MNEKAPIGRKWLNGKEAADYAGISRTTFYAWMREGRLPFRCYSIAYRIKRFSQTEIDRWLESIAREPGTGPVYPRKRK